MGQTSKGGWVGFVPGVPILLDENGRAIQQVNDETRVLPVDVYRRVLELQFRGWDDDEIFNALNNPKSRKRH